ncbi:WD40-repeat-containing domain protein [Cytidiella melzeri]|nr:WD40-repeat-containing domain protein [Cytidiella melzeri]
MQSTTPQGGRYSLKVIRAQDVLWKAGVRYTKEPDLFVEIAVDKVCRKTKVVKKTLSPTWDEDIPLLTATASSAISLRLQHDSALRNVSIGSVVVSVADLLLASEPGEARITLYSSRKIQSAVLVLRLSAVDPNANITEETTRAVQDAATIAHSPRVLAVTDATTAALAMAQSSNLYSSVESLVGKLDALKGIADELAKIHPFVSAAWTVASALYGVITKQMKADQAVVDLAEALSRSLDFALDAHLLRDKFRSAESTVARLFNQITECCLFIREYTGKGFVARMVRLEDQKSKIDAFKQSLIDSRLAVDQGVNIHAAIVTVRIASQVNQLYLKTLLEPDNTDVYGRRSCQEGTRVSVLRDITDWILTESSQNILWLYGTAGSGKSTIARSIQDHVLTLSRLGAYLCFERGKSAPNSMVRTIAYQLASYDSQIADQITTALGGSDVKATPIHNQFDVLLARPLSAASGSSLGPVVIILDALDECGDARSRRDLLRTLEGIGKLPANYRFLITGRPETDLHKAFTSPALSGHVHSIEVDCGSVETRNNVLDFLRHELRELSKPYENTELLPLWEQNVKKLADASSGLFISASTAVKMIEVSDNPFATLKELVAGETRLDELDELYSTVLTNSGIQWKKEASVSRFKDIVSFMILRKAPLCDGIIDGIMDLSLEYSSIFILEKLRPLIGYERGEPLYFRHSTISDYFLASAHAGYPWSVDIESHRDILAGQCFHSMKRPLKFNMAELQSSYYLNDAVNGLVQKVDSIISPHLRYACLYWARHLCDCNVGNATSLLKVFAEFLHERLLFWVEVLSLLKFKGADKILGDASRWLTSSSDTGTMSFLKDARKLLNTFHEPINTSIPHIYVSMLPLMRLESITAAHYYREAVACGIAFTHHGLRKPSHRLKTLRANDIRTVNTVAFSPIDRTQLVSGSDDGAIRVWDMESGELVYVPATKHDGEVSSVVYTGDGKRLVSGSRDSSVRIWNIDEPSEEVLGKHNVPVLTVAISSDNATVASGSEDGALKIWSLVGQSRETKDAPSHILSVLSVCFRPRTSVDHRWLASSSLDGSLRMWNITDGQTKNFSLADDESWVQSVIFAPDGDSLICGSDNGRIRVRSIDDHSVLRVLTGHTGSIHSLQLSPATHYLLSGSADRTLRVWDIETGNVLAGPHVEEGQIMSIAWSCDEQHLACTSGPRVSVYDTTAISASFHWDESKDPVYIDRPLSVAVISSDNTWIAGSTKGAISIWRKGPEGTWGSPQVRSGHRDHVWSIAISPDEDRLATGSADGTIRIWNVEESSSTAGPLVIKLQIGVRCVAFSPAPGSRDLAAAALDGVVRIYNSDTGESPRMLGNFAHNTSVVYSCDGNMLAAAYWDGIVRLWDVQTEALVRTLDGHFANTGSLLSLGFSSDGKIASGSQNGSVQVWDVATGQLLIDLPKAHKSHVFSLAFSPDNTRLLSASWDNTINMWDARTGGCLVKSTRGHTHRVNSAIFSSDGALIISSSRDATIRIWDTAKFVSPAPCLQEDGWLVDEQGRLLLWIPPSLRPSLLWDSAQVDVLGLPFTTRINFSNFREDGWRDGWAL